MLVLFWKYRECADSYVPLQISDAVSQLNNEIEEYHTKAKERGEVSPGALSRELQVSDIVDAIHKWNADGQPGNKDFSGDFDLRTYFYPIPDAKIGNGNAYFGFWVNKKDRWGRLEVHRTWGDKYREQSSVVFTMEVVI